MFGDAPTMAQNKLQKKKSIKYKIQKMKIAKPWKPLQKKSKTKKNKEKERQLLL